ncbi:MAG: DegT/DnrJ/EryC1/StrS family aminotransferase [Deltaproteobacteria bacterium]|uniref:DegT/DnrJ/EryC1/StrS family aminotransferase n=1 Tax=Desulfobacula sp. TaxID=2593537 RepID=UPI0019A869C4|nr:DegT/DnrJ/EryC1/StrS family aminotransferase [Candidatus Desulfobacula maris]MBL6992791.1 DegT/DnrJ/EryC1/StrS family aminotransferase [Desulfobacula sp.]
MRIGRTLPPAAAPIYLNDIFSGLKGLIRGPKEINRFESELKAHYNVKHCFLLSSGKAALTIILKALHDLYPERNEVLIPAYTCYSVPSAIVKAGLKVKLCEINPETLDFDFDQLKKILSQPGATNSKNSILAVIPTHLFGLLADVGQVRKINTDDKISIIEDAAQAMGGTLKEKKLGTLGDAGFFSLGRGKAFSIVEGGIILTNNNSIADNITKQMKTLPTYNMLEIIKLVIYSIILTIFMQPLLFWFPKSLPFLKLGETIFKPEFPIKKMSSFQAGLAKNWQTRLKNITSIRQQKANAFTAAFQKKDNLISSMIYENETHFLLKFPLKIYDTQILDRILSKSEKQGMGIMRAYPDSINNIKELKNYFKNKTYPKATMISKHLLTLPVHHFVSLSDRLQIKKLINNELGF